MMGRVLELVERRADVSDLPSLLVVGGERALLAAARVAARHHHRGGAPLGPDEPHLVERDPAAFFCRPAHVDVELPKSYETASARSDAGTFRAAAHCAYSPCGALLLDVLECSTVAQQAAVVEAAKEAARQAQISTGRRRAIVLHGADALARNLQHALRCVVEESTAVALFVLTAAREAALDEPLRSRALTVRCGGEAAPQLMLAPLAFAALCVDVDGARRRRNVPAAHRVLLSAASAARRDGGPRRAAAYVSALARAMVAAAACPGDGEEEDAAEEARAHELVARLAALEHLLHAGDGASGGTEHEWVLKAMLWGRSG